MMEMEGRERVLVSYSFIEVILILSMLTETMVMQCKSE